jgi:hypothetical protein
MMEVYLRLWALELFCAPDENPELPWAAAGTDARAKITQSTAVAAIHTQEKGNLAGAGLCPTRKPESLIFSHSFAIDRSQSNR